MAVHFFVTNDENYATCVNRGLAAIPDGTRSDINDQLSSRLAMVRRGDRILFYIIGKKEIRGVYKAISTAFYDDSPVWPDREGQRYPFRVRIDNWDYVFSNPLYLSDMYDLRDKDRLWTFSLQRPTGTNSMFSISDSEFEEILRLFFKGNRVVAEPPSINEPYRHIEPNLQTRLSLGTDGQPKYESTLAALFLKDLSLGAHRENFGDYSDYLAYVPTSFQKEIDIVLFHSHPKEQQSVVAYSIIELKRDRFTEDGLSQLLRYEDWFLKRRVGGDARAIRTAAIAKSFDPEVLTYVQTRDRLEGKKVNLLRSHLEQTRLKLLSNESV